TGNWPGKTVELAEGIMRLAGGQAVRVVDLPGTYSIGTERSRRSATLGVDEVVARDYVLDQRPDLLIAVVNASALEQDLYLVGQLLALPVRVLVAANMADVAEREGLRIDYALLGRRLGVDVVPIRATKPQELARLRQRLQQVLGPGAGAAAGEAAASAAVQTAAVQAPEGRIAPPDTPDPRSLHEWTDRVLDGVLGRPAAGRAGAGERIDAVLTHPVLGVLVLLGILAGTFWLTFGLGTPVQEWLESGLVQPLGVLLERLLAGGPEWVRGIIVDGALAGAGTVLTFLPILVIFFTCLAVLEDLGYLARGAVVMDRFMHMIGLHGKSFLPLSLGFGCNVASVMGARTIESRRGRILTAVLAPLMPCAARMTVLSFMAAAFFGREATFVIWALVTVNLFALAVLGVILSRTLLRDPEGGELLMELPAFHLPSPRVIVYLLWFKIKAFLSKAGKVIVVASMFLWAVAYFPGGELETSYLATVGKAIEPFGMLAGLDWRLMLATLASFVAKENSLAALAVLFGGGVGAGGVGAISLGEALRAQISTASAVSFLVVVMLFIPCLATVTVMKQELKSWFWTAFALVTLFVVSFGTATLVYQVAKAIM
ncbi:MAG: ferrous iron transporter B, partial [Bacillota bacterium]|nr:ferrous iron transporter B [Bacillota bacterium]